MAITTTRWSPDTCACVFDYSWDTTTSEDTRVHTPAATITRCAAHAALTDVNSHWAVLQDENPRKNKVLERLRSQFSTLTTTDSSGNVVLKDGAVAWSFDANRVLQVTTTPALTSNQKTTAQTWCDTNLGAGKVHIN